MTLPQQHEDPLHESAISDETAEAKGEDTITKAEGVPEDFHQPEIPQPKYSIGEIFTPVADKGAPISNLMGDYPIIEIGENVNGSYYYRLDTGDPTVIGWTREDCLLNRQDFDRAMNGDLFIPFLARYNLLPDEKPFYQLPVNCPICGNGTLTAWAGRKRDVNVSCSNKCHENNSFLGMRDMLDKLNSQKPVEPSIQFSIAVNRTQVNKIPKNAPQYEWKRFNENFNTETLDLKGLIEAIRAGHAITAVHKDIRKRENFISAQHVGLDFDTEDDHARLETLEKDPFISRYAALIHTTSSHKPDKPRARVIFVFDKPVTDANQYARIATALTAKYEESDSQCKDPVRAWFGSKDCEYRLLGNLLPLDVVDREILAPAAAQHPSPKWAKPQSVQDSIPEGKRNGTLASLAGTLRRRGFDTGAINAALQATNVKSCIPPLPEDEVRRIATSVGKYAANQTLEELAEEIPADPAVLLEAAKNASANDRPEALRALANALAVSDPFTVASIAAQVDAAGLCTKGEFKEAVKAAHKAQAANSKAGARDKVPTDDELADRWRGSVPPTVFGMREFRRYKDGIWPVIPIDTIKKELTSVLEFTKDEGVRPSRPLLDSVLELARLKIYVPDDQWDFNPNLLPLRNGVLSISDRKLLDHNPDYYFTNKLDFDYNPMADCPVFKYVLDSVVPEAKDFLQEYAGYALTPNTSYEVAVWLFGPPGSGKSTILGGLQAMLGPRAGLLGLADIEYNRFALTNMPGKTLVVSTEQPKEYLRASHILNAIISGEEIIVDRKFKDAVTIHPHAKLAWAMNDLPRVDPGNGLFRRVKVIQFLGIKEDNRVPNIKEAIQTESAGVLNWALEGLDRLNDRGHFEFPDCVKDATAQFQTENDAPAEFVAFCCDTDPNYKIRSSELYDAYVDWCKRTGHKSASSTTIANDWRRLGFTHYMSNGRSMWKGLKLKNPSPWFP